jgi:hypothetical protein
VAITVVLVTIIAAVIMGMTGGVGNHKNIGLTSLPPIGPGPYYLPLPITDNTRPRLGTVTGTFSEGTRQVLY